MEQQNISIDLDELLTPVIIEEKKEINIFYEYLLRCSQCKIDELVNTINKKQINKISFSRLITKKNTSLVDFSFLNGINKKSILQLAVEEISYNDLIGFDNLELLAITLNKHQKLSLKNFNKLNHITLSNYMGDNIDFNGVKTDNFSIMFYAERSSKFNYIIPFKKCAFFGFRNYTEINFNEFKSVEVEGIDIYGCKKFIMDHCDFFLSKLKKLYLDKCDLSFLNENILLKLTDLEELYINNCKNLKSLKGLPITLKKVRIFGTKIQDCDVSCLEKIPDIAFTKCKDYMK